eukprot:CAMPEP_0118923678 /NCGR_PEP_ID=MMETSP1169-20130426/2111_1 /TAXON_ID=36882 /ORGANISM="Pyramimonas obovata, Strain CCMP722" /LENGTH=640 /DNA_ID=CAMNT_0006864695 /DNA_START=151 /DNA_END=2069 /DNA_ORIENTATION=+
MASLLKQFTEGNFLGPANATRENKHDRREEDVISFPSVSSSDTEQGFAEERVQGYTHSRNPNDHSIFSSAESLGDLYQRGRSGHTPGKHPLPGNSPRKPRSYDVDNGVARNLSDGHVSHSGRGNGGGYHPGQDDLNPSYSTSTASARSRASGALERGLSPTRSQHRNGGMHSPRDASYQRTEGRQGGVDQHGTSRAGHDGLHKETRNGSANSLRAADIETDSRLLRMENEQLMQRVRELETMVQRAGSTEQKSAEDSAAVESTLNKLIQTVSKEREGRQLAEAQVGQLSQTLERERREGETQRQALLDQHSRAAALHASELKKATDMIAELRKSAEISTFKLQEAEASVHHAAARVVEHVAAALQQPAAAAASSGPDAAPEDRALVGDAVAEALRPAHQALAKVVGSKAAKELTGALQGAVAEPLLRALPELTARSAPMGGAEPDMRQMDSTTKRKFVLWLAMERERRQRAEETLTAASEALAHSEHSRLEATKQWQSAAAMLEATAGRGGATGAEEDEFPTPYAPSASGGWEEGGAWERAAPPQGGRARRSPRGGGVPGEPLVGGGGGALAERPVERGGAAQRLRAGVLARVGDHQGGGGGGAATREEEVGQRPHLAAAVPAHDAPLPPARGLLLRGRD